MKTLLKNKIGWALVLAVLMSLFLVSNCTSDPGTGRTTTTTTTTTGGTTSSERESKLACELPSCSGTCCEDVENDKCKKKCTRSYKNGLGISGSDNRDLCFDMGEKDVEKLLDITVVIDKANDDKLNELGNSEERMNLLCAGVSKLDYGILDDRIKRYSTTDAKRLLGWAAEFETALDVFENAEDDKGVPMFERLLSKADGGTVSDSNILGGLTTEVKTKEADDAEANNKPYFMRWALDRGNEEFAQWVHDEIIEDDEDGLCKDSNLPIPIVSSGSPENDYKEAACLLAVYCKMAPGNTSEDNEFRKNIAEGIAQSSDVSDLIKEAVTDPNSKGGLGLSSDDSDAEEWTRKACCQLNKKWKNGGLGDLGLGTDGTGTPYGTCS